VASPKRKTHRNPLQRLSDQRRSLALAGLAVGAVFSAAIFHRRRRGGEPELAPPAPQASEPLSTAPFAAGEPEVAAAANAATASQVDHEAPEVAAAATETASVPETETNELPVDTGSEAAAEPEAAEPPVEAASTSISDPATGELSAEEASILSVLAQHGRTDDDRTVIAVATSLERESADVANVLRKLSAEGVVSGELYTAIGDKIWAVTERGVRRLGAQH
jgi:hypothetical protein